MKDISTAVKLGVQKSALPLTVSLQQYAENLGWDANAIKRVRVRSKGDDKLTINAQGTAPETAEYGSLGTQPSPAVRQWTADQSTVETIIVSSIMAELEDVQV